MIIGPDGYVLATDISPGILEFAKENAQSAGLKNVDTKADAA
jgi:methylase of polypeptide subunit release factors